MSNNIILDTTIGNKDVKYVGRFLGFIKDDEFNALIDKPGEVAQRLESKASLPLVEIARTRDKLNGHRLVMTIKKIDDEACFTKRLFVSGRLDLIDEVAGTKVKISTDDDNVLLLEEE
jgi:hypothetical protein